MIRSPIHRVLSTFRRHRVRALLMGGQACILYGAAEFTRDSDFVVSADKANLARLNRQPRGPRRRQRSAPAPRRPVLSADPPTARDPDDCHETETKNRPPAVGFPGAAPARGGHPKGLRAPRGRLSVWA